jgi:hypothetical protein
MNGSASPRGGREGGDSSCVLGTVY